MKRKTLLFLVFITEWAILSLEMAAFKMFMPHFGSSLYIWGNIIGIVMIGASCGYYLGGKIADKRPEEKLLMQIITATGVFVILIPFISVGLLFFLGASEHLLAASFVYGIILFGIPAVLIEIVPPFAVRLENKKVETTGRSAGSIYAFSTMGGVLGILTSSFITLPWWGLIQTIFFAGTLLFLCGVIGFLKFRKT